MAMYNLLQYSSNYSDTTGSLWFYSKDEAIDFNADITNTVAFKSFKLKRNYWEAQFHNLIQIKLMEF